MSFYFSRSSLLPFSSGEIPVDRGLIALEQVGIDLSEVVASHEAVVGGVGGGMG